MAKKQKIAILTSGGDAPAMNACLYYFVKFLEEQQTDVVAVVGGFEGLIENKFKNITSEEIKPFFNNGGSVIKAGRCEQLKTKAGLDKAVENFKKHGAQSLVVIGGNGTFSGMAELSEFIDIIGIPATVDNDLYYTDVSLGFDSSANENIRLIKSIKNSCKAQSKLAIIEIMGRDCSKLALTAAVGAAADICITKEMPISESEILAKIKKLLDAKRDDIVIVSVEKLIDLSKLCDTINKTFNLDSRLFINGYAQRGCDPSASDLMLALNFASKAVELLDKKEYKQVVGIKGGQIFSVDVKKALETTSTFEIFTYNKLYK